nr:MAG: hypothetical protein ADFBMEEK_00007 [Peromyscus leucopus gammaherpesvirus]
MGRAGENVHLEKVRAARDIPQSRRQQRTILLTLFRLKKRVRAYCPGGVGVGSALGRQPTHQGGRAAARCIFASVLGLRQQIRRPNCHGPRPEAVPSNAAMSRLRNGHERLCTGGAVLSGVCWYRDPGLGEL